MKLNIRKLVELFIFNVFCSLSINAEPVIGQAAPAFTITDTKGTIVRLSDYSGKLVVLEWTNHACPYVRKHYNSGNMQRTQRTVTEGGAIWLSVISSAPGQQGYVTPAEADELTAKRASYADAVLLDPQGIMGRAYKARTTPQIFLIDTDGVLRYMGAIDNKPSTRRSSLKSAENYLLAAWKAIQAGQNIEQKNTKPYGCSIKYAD